MGLGSGSCFVGSTRHRVTPSLPESNALGAAVLSESGNDAFLTSFLPQLVYMLASFCARNAISGESRVRQQVTHNETPAGSDAHELESPPPPPPPPRRLTSGLCRMQLTLHATRRTPCGASRLVQAMSAWLVKTRRAPSRHDRDARVYDHTTTAMHKLNIPAPPSPTSNT